MRRLPRIVALLSATVVLGACTDSPTGPTSALLAAGAATEPGNAGGNKDLTVMSYNLYLGASLDPVLGAPSPGQIPARVAQVWARVQQTNFPARAGRIAAQIAAAQPHVIGLQEATLWRTRAFSAPTEYRIAYDFVGILLDSLAVRGLRYDVVASVQNFSAELPSATGVFVSMQDRDVILARRDVKTANPQGALYAARLTFPLAGAIQIEIVRGWTSVEVKYRGEWVRVFNTHLEVESPSPFAAVQEAQGRELAAIVDAEALPTIVVGDLNSAADGSSTSTYETMIAAELEDSWSAANGAAAGFTSGQAENLLNPVALFRQRIDYVLFRGNDLGGFSARFADVLGEELQDRTAGGLWPSDHAGVVATLRLENPKFLQ
jgi:endonuclease/exonuclease/phosphatase family metal-dependent hydrolase